MKHPLFVGHFDVNVRSFRPKVTKPIDLEKVHAVLLAHCDKEADGTPMAAELVEEVALPAAAGKWLGQIGQEDVHAKAGYLICPWLSGGVNKESVRFICNSMLALVYRFMSRVTQGTSRQKHWRKLGKRTALRALRGQTRMALG